MSAKDGIGRQSQREPIQQVSLGSITLEVGQGPAETVTVTTEQELVKDSDVRTSAIISRHVDDMPLQGRNWVTLLKVLPGANAVASTGESIAFNGREYTSTGYADFRINGKAPSQTQVNPKSGSCVSPSATALWGGRSARKLRPHGAPGSVPATGQRHPGLACV
jgi:hypothetical protein